MSYTHFTLEEREYLQQLLSEGYSFRKIADILDKAHNVRAEKMYSLVVSFVNDRTR